MRNGVHAAAMTALLVVLLAACQALAPAATPTAEPEPSPTPTAEPTPTPEPSETPPTGLVDTLDDVRHATVRIEAGGLVADPSGVFDTVSGGSGFIIDPSGIVVTNNHVVTGSTVRSVFVGDDPREYQAIIVGASECSDLAVLRLNPPGEFRYLAWREGPVRPTAEELYAVGYPEGVYRHAPGTINSDPQPQATRFSAAREVIEIDANIIAGNSGGPLVNVDGEVVGVNYAGISETRQSFALAGPEAQRVVDKLRQGINDEWIGVNGTAFDLGTATGVFVHGVSRESPASSANLRPGQVIVTLGDQLLATDGTMSEYCSVLRSHLQNAQIEITVYDPQSRTCSSGELNNTARPLSPVDCFFPLPPGDGNGDPQGPLEPHIPTGFVSTCESLDPFMGAVESIQCFPGNPVEIAFYDRFASVETLLAEYDRAVTEDAGLSTGAGTGCDTGQPSERSWSDEGVTLGRIVCYVSNTDQAVLIWTHEQLRILTTAVGVRANIARLLEWWQGDSGPNL